MSKLVLTRVGGDLHDSVVLEAASQPSPGPDEVVVAVEAAPINGADLLFAAGWFGVFPEVPAAMGAEGVGHVVEVGSQADPALVGRQVIVLPTFRHGTWATSAAVPAASVVTLTERADPLQLAMLPVNPATAYALLHDYVSLRPGDWVGLNLANSAVAHYLIPMARRAGVRTLGVVRREDAADQARGLGAEDVVVDGENLGERVVEALGGSRLRVLFEGTGDPAHVSQLVSAIEDGGSVIAFSSVTGQTPAVPLADLIYRQVSLRAFYILSWLRDTPRDRLERIYAELAELVARGAISAEVEATYPLEEYDKALRQAQQTGRTGKVLFTPDAATG